MSPAPVRRSPVRHAAPALACLALAGCGAGTAGIAAGASGGGGGGGGDPTLTSFAVVQPKLSPATLQLEASRGVTAELFYAAGGGAMQPMAGLSGPGVAGNRASLAAGRNDLAWDFATDLGATSFQDDVELSVRRPDGGPLDGGTLVVGMGNDPPVVESVAPQPTNPAEPDESSGIVEVEIAVSDSSGDVVSLAVEWQRAGDPPDVWLPATEAGMLPQGIKTPDDGGSETVSFFWNTNVDLADDEAEVVLRATATDPVVAGDSTPSQDEFRVDNNEEPLAVLDATFFTGVKDRGNIPIPFQVFDDESDEVDVVVQWRAQGQTFADPSGSGATLDFPRLPDDPADLRDLLANPVRAAERQALQIAAEAPPAFEGRIGSLATPLPPDRVHLPELGSSAAGLLAPRHGIAGRVLEILRPTGIPEPVVWEANPLASPVAALLLDDGGSALVLDVGSSGWRVREIELETGAVLAMLASGPGAPRALALDPQREHFFVGSTSAVLRFDLLTGVPLGTVQHTFADGPRGLAALGSNVVVATGDDLLVRFDLEQGTQAMLVDGLAEPWGVVRDVLAEGSLLVAERALDRVVAIDIDEGVPGPIAAAVAPEDAAVLGPVALPSPWALALERRGELLLVLCDEGVTASLRTLSLRSPIDFDGAPDGFADPFVREVTDELPDAGAGLSTGIDRTRIVVSPSTDELLLGGGVAQRRRIVREPGPGEAGPAPYDPATRTVRLETPLDPVPQPGTPWRVRAPLRAVGGPAGRSFVYVWDSTDVPDPSGVQVRILPLDAELGTETSTNAFRPYRSDLEPAAVSLPVGFRPRSVAAADLDGDGDQDLVSTNEGDELRLYLQTAPGVFTPAASPLPAGDRPQSVAAADLDGDGDQDLVSANESGGLTLFFQTAPGVFAPMALVSPLVGADFTSVAVADLDGDGDQDVVSADERNDDLTLFFQGPPGVFMPASSRLPAHDPLTVAAGDLDGDGDQDLVSGNDGSDDLTLFFQTTPGVFTPAASTLPMDVLPCAVSVADLDGDGDQDLVSADGLGLRLFFQGGPGVFTPAASTLGTGLSPCSVAVADLDGDGDRDLATTHSFNGDVRLFFQSSPGAFTLAPTPLSMGGDPVSVAATDLDGDGDQDLVSVNLGSGDLTLFLQRSTGAFAEAVSSLPGDSPRSVVATDLDGDGDQDLVSANFGSLDLKLFFQSAPGIFVEGQSMLRPTNVPTSVAAADLDGDGDQDLVSTSASYLTFFFRNGSGGFTPVEYHSPGLSASSMAVGDLDGDGDSDLAVASGGLRLFFQRAPGVFTPATSPLPTGGNALFVVAADLDEDGDLDLLSANEFGNDLILFFQSAPGVFTPGDSPLPAPSIPVSAVVADLDGDGDQDLVSANVVSARLLLFFQTAPGVFTPAASPLPLPGVPSSVAAADLDGDGDQDLISSNRLTAGPTLFFQSAPGVFTQAASPLPARDGARSVAVADLDGDGDQDLAAVSGALTLFFNGD